jgi:hypothetical protein
MNTDEHGWSAPHARRVGADPGSPQHHPCSSVFICVHLWFQSLPCCQAGKDRMGLRAVSARGAVRTIRAATLRICQRADAGRRGGVGGRGWHSAPFRQIAQLPYATVWRPMQAGGAVSVAGGGTRRHSDKSRSYPMQLFGGRCGPAGWCRWRRGTRRHSDKSRSYPMQRGAGQQRGDGRGSDRMARLAVVAGHEMRNSCKDPMQRGAGQQCRDGRGSDRPARLAVVAGAECDFRAKTLWSGEWTRRAGMVGVRPGRQGWRVWPSMECDFAQRPYAMGSRAAAPGWMAGFTPNGAAGGCAGHGIGFSDKDPMDRAAGQQGRHGRGADQPARLAVVAGHGIGFSDKDPMDRGAERSAGVATGLASGPAQGARSAASGQDPMNRDTEWTARVATGLAPGPAQGARSATSGQDPMNRGTERRPGWPPGWRLAQRRARGPQHQDKTL